VQQLLSYAYAAIKLQLFNSWQLGNITHSYGTQEMFPIILPHLPTDIHCHVSWSAWLEWYVWSVCFSMTALEDETRRQTRHTTKYGAGRIWTVTYCGSLGPICGSAITLGFRLGLGFGSGLELRFGLGLGLQNVVYKLLEKATKCGSITWLKLTGQWRHG